MDKGTINKTIMENKVKIQLHSYRQLLESKLKGLTVLEETLNKQNEPIFAKLLSEGVLTNINNNILPSNLITVPADGKQFTQEEIKHNEAVTNKVIDLLNQNNVTNYLEYDIDELVKLLCFTIDSNDITKCLIP